MKIYERVILYIIYYVFLQCSYLYIVERKFLKSIQNKKSRKGMNYIMVCKLKNASGISLYEKKSTVVCAYMKRHRIHA